MWCFSFIFGVMRKKIYLEDEKPLFLKAMETLVQIAVVSLLGLFMARFLFFPLNTVSRAMEPHVNPGSVVWGRRKGWKPPSL